MILLEMLPEVPSLPSFPEITWVLVDDQYAISADDADKLLDYMENQIPTYSFEMEQYKKKLEILVNALILDA